MSTLTEDMVIARTKGGGDIRTIRKLNCWGASLTDITLVREMVNLEVIAFSVNQISCLADFQYCTRVQELYLRGNNISDINQVCYLQELHSLRHLWLNENPIENTPLYRETVIRTLPFLQKLDNNDIGTNELENARRVGRELIHPSQQDGRSPSPQSVASSRSPSPPPQQRSPGYSDDSRPASPRRAVRHSPPRTIEAPKLVDLYIERRDSQGYEQESSGYSSARQNYSNYDDTEEEVEHNYERVCRQVQQVDLAPSRALTNHRLSYPSRPSIRSANILSSVLLLIKELDIASLEVVSVAVQSRIGEISDD